MTGLYLLMEFVTIVGIIVFLSFVGPEESDEPFWKVIHKTRDVLDAGSYWIICGIAISSIAIVLVQILIRIFL